MKYIKKPICDLQILINNLRTQRTQKEYKAYRKSANETHKIFVKERIARSKKDPKPAMPTMHSIICATYDNLLNTDEYKAQMGYFIDPKAVSEKENCYKFDNDLLDICCRRGYLMTDPLVADEMRDSDYLRRRLAIHKEWFEEYSQYFYVYDYKTNPLESIHSKEQLRAMNLELKKSIEVMAIRAHRLVRCPKTTELTKNKEVDAKLQYLITTNEQRDAKYKVNIEYLKSVKEHKWTSRKKVTIKKVTKPKVYVMYNDIYFRSYSYYDSEGVCRTSMGLSTIAYNKLDEIWCYEPMKDIAKEIGEQLHVGVTWKEISAKNDKGMSKGIMSWYCPGNFMWVNNIEAHEKYESIFSMLRTPEDLDEFDDPSMARYDDVSIIVVVKSSQCRVSIWDPWLLNRQLTHTDYVYVRLSAEEGKLMTYLEYREWALDRRLPPYAEATYKTYVVEKNKDTGKVELNETIHENDRNMVPMLRHNTIMYSENESLPSHYKPYSPEYFETGLRLIDMLCSLYDYQTDLIYRESMFNIFDAEKHEDYEIRVSAYQDPKTVPYYLKKHSKDAEKAMVHRVYNNKKIRPVYDFELVKDIEQAEEFFKAMIPICAMEPELFSKSDVVCPKCGKSMRLCLDLRDEIKNGFGILDETEIIERLEFGYNCFNINDPVYVCRNNRCCEIVPVYDLDCTEITSNFYVSNSDWESDDEYELESDILDDDGVDSEDYEDDSEDYEDEEC